jgi:hypothetical protein
MPAANRAAEPVELRDDTLPIENAALDEVTPEVSVTMTRSAHRMPRATPLEKYLVAKAAVFPSEE